ncbi:MAG: Rrf2 family transcriptional regulator [Candidatus Nealsonbacteria bacterium]|nr:MAG: Rrf2 family transcriptional regulator [Candidatus Nealsonbacteria bacterium]
MRISKKSQYGLRAMVYLAGVFGKEKKICSLREISEKENISFDYLEKIMSKLEKADLVKAKKGVQGGYFLKRSPQKINVGEIIRVLESTMSPVKCLAKEKRYNCPRKKTCKTLNVWKKVQEVLNSTLESITLADLIKKK